MPYADEFDAVFAATKSAVDALPVDNFECVWLKDEFSAGRITDAIVGQIEKSALCIADVSGNNPNVMWETGYAMALGRPTILIGRSIETLPFDLKVHQVLSYHPQELKQFTEKLSKAVKQTLAKYELPKIDQRVRPPGPSGAIAVTGSMNADRAKANQRIVTILQPYLNRGITWYCGSVGVIDELVAEYLVSEREQVVAVGYDRFDFSTSFRKLIEQNKIAAVDASVESLPKGFTGPTERDVLFAIKAQLVILFWDGKSHGTEALFEYFKSSGVNTVIGFI
jgi:hypothetical protein